MYRFKDLIGMEMFIQKLIHVNIGIGMDKLFLNRDGYGDVNMLFVPSLLPKIQTSMIKRFFFLINLGMI